jgi:hypothetical protein
VNRIDLISTWQAHLPNIADSEVLNEPHRLDFDLLQWSLAWLLVEPASRQSDVRAVVL